MQWKKISYVGNTDCDYKWDRRWRRRCLEAQEVIYINCPLPDIMAAKCYVLKRLRGTYREHSLFRRTQQRRFSNDFCAKCATPRGLSTYPSHILLRKRLNHLKIMSPLSFSSPLCKDKMVEGNATSVTEDLKYRGSALNSTEKKQK